MFVALVGLSGLAALFWLGGIEMSEGAKLDRATSVARSAQRSLKIYGMVRPIQACSNTPTSLVQTWITPAGATVDGSGTPASGSPVQPVMPFSGTSFGGVAAPSVAYGYFSQGFAIDPLGVIANPASNVDSNNNPFVPAFPGVARSLLRHRLQRQSRTLPPQPPRRRPQ